MSKANKTLVLVFIVLLAVTIGEIAYFFVIQPKKQVLKSTSGVNITSTKTTTSASSPIDENKVAFEKKQRDWIYHWVKTIKKGNLSSSILNNTYQGKIIEINLNYTSTSASQLNYRAKIKLVGTKKFNQTLLYTQDDLQKTKVNQFVNQKVVPLKLSDLKVGDIVTVAEKIDLTKEPGSNMVSNVILKQ